ncbi:MAG: hypothetical protein OXN16_02780 [Gammaproteobacteria bacterium]|nr:hypothetical protein [Gammaproteobacteria bacterium]
MLLEAATLHRRFPYAVLVGVLILDKESANDATKKRRSTFENAHHSFKPFTGRNGVDEPEEKFEYLYFLLHDANPIKPTARVYSVGNHTEEVDLDSAFDNVVALLAERNPTSTTKPTVC